MTHYRGPVALLAMVIGLGGPPVLGDEGATRKAADKVSPPEVEMAAAAAKKVERDEAAWRELTDRLRKAVEQYNPVSLNVLPERQSLEAFRGYCGKLLESGRNLVVLHEKWDRASEGLADSLRKAPAYYRGAGKAMREKAEAMKFALIKKRYLLSAEIWEELALKAEERSRDLRLDQRATKLVELLREELAFLEDFCKTLDAVPGLPGPEGSRYGELMEVLRKHTERSDELERQLRLFRNKLKARDGAGSR